MEQPITFRPLTSSDSAAFRALHQAVIHANPECFCTAVSEAEQYQLNFYRAQIKEHSSADNRRLYGAFSPQGELLGMVGIEQLNGLMRCHKARLWGLMVHPTGRRRGLAQQLCQQAIAFARQLNTEKITLELTGSAIAALHLYRGLGFRIETVEPMALKLNSQYLDEIRMALTL